MNFWKRYPGDYTGKTAHLSLAEHGAYTLLLDAYYAQGESLSGESSLIYRICRATTAADKRAVDAVLRQFFRKKCGRWVNDRADQELQIAAARIEIARKNGAAGGRPQKPKKNPAGFQNETQTLTQKKPTAKAPQNQIKKEEEKARQQEGVVNAA